MRLFHDLAFWERRPEAWRELTRGDILFQALHRLVQRGALPPEARQWVEACQAEFPLEECRWNIIQALLWCAEEAATRPDCTQVDRVCFALGQVPKFIQPDNKPRKWGWGYIDKAWAWGCIQTFLDTTPVRERAIQVPVALCRHPEGTAFLASLWLEVFPSGGGVLPYPADALLTHFDEAFGESMAQAWEAAKKLAHRQDADMLVMGRWRLLQRRHPSAEEHPLKEEVSGRSVSGAAALGWYHVLKGTLPDAGILVLAQVQEGGTLGEVDEVPAKVKAIATDEHIDTLVVAGKKNQREAEDTLRQLGKGGLIRVKNLTP